MKGFIQKKPVLAYFILTFVISWSGVLAISFFMGMPATSTHFNETGPLALIPFLLGPTVVSLFLTGFVNGKPGLRELRSRFLRWRINIGWYVFAVLLTPVLLSVILFVLSLFSSGFIPKIITEDEKTSLVITGVITGLVGGGLFEEIGWTGFATPQLRSRYGILRTGLVIGFLWGLWHLLPVLWGSGDVDGKLDWALFLPGLFSHYAVLVPYRILLVWLHERTGSLIPVIIMHASLTCFLLFILNIPGGGFSLFVYYLAVSLALWVVVALCVLSLRMPAGGPRRGYPARRKSSP